jgi:hypothetical protein
MLLTWHNLRYYQEKVHHKGHEEGINCRGGALPRPGRVGPGPHKQFRREHGKEEGGVGGVRPPPPPPGRVEPGPYK